MWTYVVAFAMSFLVVVFLTPVAKWVAHRYKLVEVGSGRKVHRRPVPRIGGLAIAAAFYVPLVGLLVYENKIHDIYIESGSQVLGLFACGLIIVFVGLVDDLRGLGATVKLAVEIAVAIAMWVLHYRIFSITNPFGGPPLPLGIFALPITIIWIVGVINAVNLIDGLDGLAAGLALIAIATLFILSISSDHVLVALYMAALGGAVLGFLLFNFNPAKIFMGDSGAMFVGFVIAASSISGTSKGNVAIALFVPVLALGVPILDTFLAIARRIARRHPIFLADREHLHHKLLDMGMSQKKAVLILYGLGVVLMILALGVLSKITIVSGASIVVSIIIVAVVLRYFGYMKTKSGNGQGDDARGGPITDRVRGAIPNLVNSEHDDVWQAIEAFASETGLEEVEFLLVADGEELESKLWPSESSNSGGKKPGHKVSLVLSPEGNKGATYRFSWISGSLMILPEEEAVFQIVADLAWQKRGEGKESKKYESENTI